MTLSILLLLLFVSISLVVYCSLSSTTTALDNYSRSLSVSTESNLRKLFLFADTRKLLLLYLGVLLLLPMALLYLQAGLVFVGVTIGVLVIAPRWVFARLAARRRSSINAALPDALSQIAGAMRAGSTLVMAIQSYVDEGGGPLRQEFSLLLRELRVGARLEDALDNMAERVQSEEMDLVVSASLIANDVGGNLAEILLSLSDTLRRKLEMEGKIAALTAQGRLQGRVVAALPFVILVPLSILEPEAIRPLFHSILGWLVLTIITVMVVTGTFLISKIVSIDV